MNHQPFYIVSKLYKQHKVISMYGIANIINQCYTYCYQMLNIQQPLINIKNVHTNKLK